MHTDNETIKRKYEGKLVIGITGGAGSGKSTVVELLKSKFDTEFIHCDEIAHELMEPGGKTYIPLLKEYGKGILEEGSEKISRPKLTKAANESPKGFKRLNEITHPIVIDEVVKRIRDSRHRLVLIEAALLIESGITGLCDDVWFVYAFKNERIGRIKASRPWDDEKIVAILDNQLSDEEFKAGSTFVLENHDGSDEWKQRAVERIKVLDGK